MSAFRSGHASAPSLMSQEIPRAMIGAPVLSRLAASPESGAILLPATGGGDLVSLAAYLFKISQADAALRVAEIIRVEPYEQ